VVSVRSEGAGKRLGISLPRSLARFLITKGSIAVDGVSLTVAAARAARFEVALIPFTLSRTTLGALRAGDPVNIETDLLARHATRLRGKRG
ncbi:MAG: riboflavin synthase, partial [bacterium]